MENTAHFPALSLLPIGSDVLITDYDVENVPVKDFWYSLEVTASEYSQDINLASKLPNFNLDVFNSTSSSPYSIKRSYMHFALLYLKIETIFGKDAKSSFKISKRLSKNKSIASSGAVNDSFKNDDIKQLLNSLFFDIGNYNIKISDPVTQFFGPWESDLPFINSFKKSKKFRIPTLAFESNQKSRRNNILSYFPITPIPDNFVDLNDEHEAKDQSNNSTSKFNNSLYQNLQDLTKDYYYDFSDTSISSNKSPPKNSSQPSTNAFSSPLNINPFSQNSSPPEKNNNLSPSSSKNSFSYKKENLSDKPSTPNFFKRFLASPEIQNLKHTYSLKSSSRKNKHSPTKSNSDIKDISSPAKKNKDHYISLNVITRNNLIDWSNELNSIISNDYSNLESSSLTSSPFASPDPTSSTPTKAANQTISENQLIATKILESNFSSENLFSNQRFSIESTPENISSLITSSKNITGRPSNSFDSPANDPDYLNAIIDDKSLNPLVQELYIDQNLVDSALTSYTPSKTSLKDLLNLNPNLFNFISSNNDLYVSKIILSYTKSKRVLTTNSAIRINQLLLSKIDLPVLKLFFNIASSPNSNQTSFPPTVLSIEDVYTQIQNMSLVNQQLNDLSISSENKSFPINKNSITREYFKKLNELKYSEPNDYVNQNSSLSQSPQNLKSSFTSISSFVSDDIYHENILSDPSTRNPSGNSNKYSNIDNNSYSPKTKINALSYQTDNHQNFNPENDLDLLPSPKSASHFYIGNNSRESLISINKALVELPTNQNTIKSSLGYHNLDSSKIPMSNPNSENSFYAYQMSKVDPIAPELSLPTQHPTPSPDKNSPKLSRNPTTTKLNDSIVSIKSLKDLKRHKSYSLKPEPSSQNNFKKNNSLSQISETNGIGLLRTFSLKTKKAVFGTIKVKPSKGTLETHKTVAFSKSSSDNSNSASSTENYQSAVGPRKFIAKEAYSNSRDSKAIFAEMERQLSVRHKLFNQREKVVSANYLNSYITPLPGLTDSHLNSLKFGSSAKKSKFLVTSPDYKSSLLRNDIIHFKFIIGENCSIIIPFPTSVSFLSVREKMISKFYDSGLALSKLKRLVMAVNLNTPNKITFIENSVTFKETIQQFCKLNTQSDHPITLSESKSNFDSIKMSSSTVDSFKNSNSSLTCSKNSNSSFTSVKNSDSNIEPINIKSSISGDIDNTNTFNSSSSKLDTTNIDRTNC
ncbi:hypothetical protein AYI70_g5931, partial [Smittium culicis]